jgi:hypothetical protein
VTVASVFGWRLIPVFIETVLGNILARMIVPPTFFLITSSMLIPNTSSNVFKKIVHHLPSEYQEKVFETQAEAEKLKSKMTDSIQDVRIKVKEISTGLKESKPLSSWNSNSAADQNPMNNISQQVPVELKKEP